MARRRLLVLTLATLATNYLVAGDAVPACPSGLQTVLSSPACNGHRLHVVTAPHTVIEKTDPAHDFCVDALGILLMAAPSIPCTANLSPSSSDRRLSSSDGSFAGSLECTFNMTAPRNASDPSQGFAVDCKVVQTPSKFTWVWWTLGVLGAAIALVGLSICAAGCFYEIRGWCKRRRQRLLNRAEHTTKDLLYALV